MGYLNKERDAALEIPQCLTLAGPYPFPMCNPSSESSTGRLLGPDTIQAWVEQASKSVFTTLSHNFSQCSYAVLRVNVCSRILGVHASI